MASLYRYADLDVLMNVLLRQAVALAPKKTLHACREAVVAATVKMLYTYRKMCASASTAAGQLILPESLKLLPLYALSLTKHGALRPGVEVRADERAALMAAAVRMPVACSVAFIYPRLFSLMGLSDSVGALDTDGTPHLPPSTPLAAEKLDGARPTCSTTRWASTCGWARASQPRGCRRSCRWAASTASTRARLRVPLLENETSLRVNRLINAVRSQRPMVLAFPRVTTPQGRGARPASSPCSPRTAPR